jgi:hypothetical protein
MNKDSCFLVKKVLLDSHSGISKYIKSVIVDNSKAKGKWFYSMEIRVKDTHLHLLNHIKSMAYKLIACCNAEYLSTTIKEDVLYLD